MGGRGFRRTFCKTLRKIEATLSEAGKSPTELRRGWGGSGTNVGRIGGVKYHFNGGKTGVVLGVYWVSLLVVKRFLW